MKVYLIVNYVCMKASVGRCKGQFFLLFKSRELYVLSPGKSAPLANFQPHWTSRNRVSVFSHFIFSLSKITFFKDVCIVGEKF